MNTTPVTAEVPTYKWWASQRLRFNLLLVAAAPVSFACFLLVWLLFQSRLPCLEVTAFTVALDALAFLVGLLAANVCYFIGPLIELLIRPSHAMVLRKRLFAAGTGFSVLLIFSPVLAILVSAIVGPTPGASCYDTGL